MADPQMHTCTVCDKTGPWSDSWTWYGSLRDLDDGEPIAKFCSEPCKDKWAAEAKALRDQERAIRAEAVRKGMRL